MHLVWRRKACHLFEAVQHGAIWSARGGAPEEEHQRRSARGGAPEEEHQRRSTRGAITCSVEHPDAGCSAVKMKQIWGTHREGSDHTDTQGG